MTQTRSLNQIQRNTKREEFDARDPSCLEDERKGDEKLEALHLFLHGALGGRGSNKEKARTVKRDLKRAIPNEPYRDGLPRALVPR